MTGWRYALEFGDETFELGEGTVVLGRSQSTDVTIADASVSRRHAELTLAGGQVTIRDLGSSNGTWLNGRRIGEAESLVPGDVLELGEAEVRFRASPPPVAAGGAPAADPMATVRMPVGGGEPAAQGGHPPQAGPRQAGPATFELQRSSVELARQALGEEGGLHADLDATSPPARPDGRLDTGSFDTGAHEAVTAPAEEIAAALPPPPPPPPVPAAAPPPATHRPPTGVAVAAAAAEPAGLGVRFLALLVDDLWILVAAALLYWLGDAVGGAVVANLAALLPLVVVVVGWATRGLTPGKRLLGLVVTTLDGSREIGFGRALLRLLGYLLGAIPMGLGFLVAVLHPERRALHDLMAGTVVIPDRVVPDRRRGGAVRKP